MIMFWVSLSDFCTQKSTLTMANRKTIQKFGNCNTLFDEFWCDPNLKFLFWMSPIYLFVTQEPLFWLQKYFFMIFGCSFLEVDSADDFIRTN